MKIPKPVQGYDKGYEEHYDRGNVLFEMDRLEEALDQYDKALNLNPNHAWSHGNRAIVLEAQGRYREAMKSVERALALAPNDPDFVATKKAILEQMEEVDQGAGRGTLERTLLLALHEFDGQKALWALRAGASPMCMDSDGNTPLHLFYRCPELSTAEKVARELVARGANLEARNRVGDTPWVKLQCIKNEAHRAGLSRVLEELGATRDEAALQSKKERINAKRTSVEQLPGRDIAFGWDVARRESAENEIRTREERQGQRPDLERMKRKIATLMEFDRRLHAQGCEVSITELLDQLERLEHRELLKRQSLQTNRDYPVHRSFVAVIAIGLILAVLYLLVRQLGWL